MRPRPRDRRRGGRGRSRAAATAWPYCPPRQPASPKRARRIARGEDRSRSFQRLFHSPRPIRGQRPERLRLAKRPPICQRTVFPQNFGSMMSASWEEVRRDRRFARGTAGGPLWHFLKGFIKHPVMVGSVIPSSKAVIDKMLGPVDWAKCKTFVEYGPG